ncbi:MAG: sensor domain-containing diguanylate cyclase [archaeon]|nr:sensor domain-containing diguanylate cyclase [archaeon]
MNSSFKDTVDNLLLGVCFVDCDKKITYWNRGAENLIGLNEKEVMGKKFGISKENCPVGLTLGDGEQRESDAFLKHKGGEKIHVKFRVTPIRDVQEKIVGATVMFHDMSKEVILVNKIKELQRTSSYDFLTGLPNRLMFEKALTSRFEEMQRNNREFGLLFLDIDNFKKINDNYGHNVGDLVLQMVAKKLQSTLRPYDTLGRWGGEEFVALIPHVNREQLYAVSSRLRSMVERSSLFTGDIVVKVTLSIGATLSKSDDSIDSLVKRADKLMYMSKTTGKNKVTIEMKN